MSDPLFPLPSPDWIFVQDLTVLPHSSPSPVVDAEGRWEYASNDPVPVKGYFATPNPREVERAAAAGVVVDGVALFPSGTSVVVDDGVGYDGDTYRVALVQPNPSHMRVLLTRVDGTDPPWHFPGS